MNATVAKQCLQPNCLIKMTSELNFISAKVWA